ncbi:Hypothetical protein LEPBI_I3316 [Leptospira biflexa serovar Patoc strain 'Patoc 1 (Paris)']|uniref:Uncharacterized protein n=1 Tax=Leptospira biflexa serovar Patoc (strain Patoc 1 / ATCC 23582 / Paris) TaxID=456481 RepID=B0SR89_LEPBP|nr:Hypothetical protein LEPBI_I3316 [Leptospira biflexa serovar Patoc strain 'Patoc 1 (Paris)']
MGETLSVKIQSKRCHSVMNQMTQTARRPEKSGFFYVSIRIPN